MRIKKIFTNISNITFSASSVSFYLIINGGSTVFLLISIISIFINKLSINIPDENLKNIIDSLISYNKNYTFSIILFITSVYSTSTLFKSYLKGTEIITNTKYINNKRISSILFSLLLPIIFIIMLLIFILLRIINLLSVLLIYVLLYFLFQYILQGFALRNINIKILYRGIIISFLFSFSFSLFFIIFLNYFSFKEIYGVFSLIISFIFFLYINIIGLYLGIYYNWKKIEECNYHI